ncbi:SDR family NAD(P)-dependent oxidoreductase [Ureaplasma sp. ES3154-GEN]|uniref:SDR family NAD(P)-dependent oxidoreductase n=1 Tax=Ureaplasma sp. ES3154-GEN TaxID=2984844 RepID=UPI0021E84DDB|nr:SDR family NAD(P)-dependent oxidoreductase [Ureaplasma sp. ES3154-GEN]MCV3743775.1 SDR family NAD(P)-dependent oxidoreductase [Ureaplasma sp. ES3154-GEN]
MHKFNWQKKKVVCTGVTSGIGLSLLQLLLTKPIHLTLLVRNKIKIKEILSKVHESYILSCKIVSINLDDANMLINVKNTIESTDILINNAGYGIFDEAQNISDENERKLWQTNVLTPISLTKAVINYMYNQQSGLLVYTSSVAAHLPIPYSAIYNASKAAIEQYVNTLKIEAKKYNVKTLLITPGAVSTNFFTNADKNELYTKYKKGSVNPLLIAQQIIKAIEKQKDRIIVPKKLWFAIKLNNLWPNLVHKVLSKKFIKK